MVTVRSYYSFEQFKQVFQKFAHEVAIDAVTNLNQGRVRITSYSGKKFEHVDTEHYIFSFYASRIVFIRTIKKDEHFGFDVEEKEYTNSNHRTKLSYDVQIEHELVGNDWVEKENHKEKERIRGEEITAFIEDLMKKNEIKPVPRFSLQQTRK